ncbi:TetR/AcrR family transcriptional regulator [Bacillus horti]|uniref:AcrR family transcriptional regulator n=1 Tax=Caldalkalibacillus horti TaxID=77523 RepID=A0ABT9W0M2_9BACI|nr:TetR/AcrR family transcriptional regulator [Bacillus horti]MDQ0166807.1 AcrR family transcriptional regulator [Bacillus horti]
MSTKDRVFEVAVRLVAEKPFDQITMAEIAQEAGVHWTSVRRYFGGKTEMREWLRDKQMSENYQLSDTRSRIIKAAATVFSKIGYHQASLDLVAEHTGMTKGAVYWHFSSKQDLFLALLEQHLQQQIRLLSIRIEALLTSPNPRLALEEWLKEQLEGLAENKESAGLFMEFVVASREKEVRDRLTSLQRDFLQHISELIADMQHQGRIRASINPSSFALLIDSILKGAAVEWMIDPERADLSSYIHTVSAFLWENISPSS